MKLLYLLVASTSAFQGMLKPRNVLNLRVSTLTESDEEILFGSFPEPTANPLDNTNNPEINKLRKIRETITSCPQLWLQLADVSPNRRALYDGHLCDRKIDVTFAEMKDIVLKSAAIFDNLGVKDNNVAVFGENSAVWLFVDQGIQLAGGATAVRGADAPLDELRYIYEHSDSRNIAVLQDLKLFKKLLNKGDLGLSNQYGKVQTIILMHRGKSTDAELQDLASAAGVDVQVFSDLLDVVQPMAVIPDIPKSTLSTIVYTSGTTGRPKGVMLTHGNLLHQLTHRLAPSKPFEQSEPLPGETMVSLLPVWHITERTFELWMASRGCNIVYSSIRYFKKDLALHKPEWLVLVPRVLEKIASGVSDKFKNSGAAVKVLSNFFTKVGSTFAKHRKIVDGLTIEKTPIPLKSRLLLALLSPLNSIGNKLVWSKVQDGFGGTLKTVISGGSALSGGLEEFYETAGIPILVGYGLTECSPLLAYRRADANLVTAGCAGQACDQTTIRIVDPETFEDVKPGNPGLVIANGPQVMKGYYKNTEATKSTVIDGWFHTGDLGKLSYNGDLILTGRAKDTIVLSNGENIEPTPLEDAIVGDALIDQVMLTGQDGKALLAICVLNPIELANLGYLEPSNAEKLQAAMDAINDPHCEASASEPHLEVLQSASAQLRQNKQLEALLSKTLKTATSGNRPWEKVSEGYITLEPFAMVNAQLTQSYKVKRAQVLERYEAEL